MVCKILILRLIINLQQLEDLEDSEAGGDTNISS